jgi:hypothetical protein
VPYRENRDLPLEERLEASRLEIQRLREENSRLLEASKVFGQLAERLNTQLQEERRRGEADRRRWSRLGTTPRRSGDGGSGAQMPDSSDNKRHI